MIARAAALAWLLERAGRLEAEPIAAGAAAGRVLAADVAGVLAGPVCGLDGVAVRAAATEGASAYAPLPVRSVAVVAGDDVPVGTDAVLPADWFEAGCALAAVAAGHGVQAAERFVLEAGLVVRPGHLALLAGAETVMVVRRPVVRLLVAGSKRGPERLRAMLTGLVADAGGVVGDEGDLVLLAGRSGLGTDDDGVRGLETVFAHGVAMRPGSRAAVGLSGERPALLLPGDAAACLGAFGLLAAPVVRTMAGLGAPAAVAVAARLEGKIVSGLGMEEAVPVVVRDGVASPVFGWRALAADGVVMVDAGSEGLAAGSAVRVWMR